MAVKARRCVKIVRLPRALHAGEKAGTMNVMLSTPPPTSSAALFNFPRSPGLADQLHWLGPDYAAGLAASLENGFDRQQPGTRLAALKCIDPPELSTRALPTGLVTAVQARFALHAYLQSPHAGVWWLDLDADFTATGLDGPDGGSVQSDVAVISSRRIEPAGTLLLDDLRAVGPWLETRQERLEWGAFLEEILLFSDPQVENEAEDEFFVWQDESILNGLRGDLVTSFPPDRPTLRYVTLGPASAIYQGAQDDGLLPEWEHLVAQFGLHHARIATGGFRWNLGEIEIDLFSHPTGEAETFNKFLAIHWLGEE